MSLLNEHLSVWEIGFRWVGLDQSGLYLRLPLQVRDNFRLMMDAILHGNLVCSTLSLNKWQPEDGEDERPFFIRHHLADVEACIWGMRFSRKLLRWAAIDRWDFLEWCERQGIPPPEFWYPKGWKLEFELPREDEDTSDEAGDTSGESLRPSAQHRIACREIAKALWKEEPDTTIADMVKDARIRKLGGAAHYSEDTVRRWLSAVAPASVKEKRGRPPKKKGNEAD